MQLINADGMAFIGPGSEWFWTALTGIVLAITFIALYRQLRLQAHATAVEQVRAIDRESSSEQTKLQDFEWLAGVMAEMNRRAGMPAITPAEIKSGIDRAIPLYQGRIRAAEALRTVILAQPVAVTVTRPAPAE